MMHDIVFYKKRLGSISNIVVWHNSYGSTNSDLNIKKGWIVSIDVKYLDEDDNKVHLWIGESIRPTALEKLDMSKALQRTIYSSSHNVVLLLSKASE